METGSTRYSQGFQNIDFVMKDKINKIPSGEVQNQLPKKWKQDVDEKEKSQNKHLDKDKGLSWRLCRKYETVKLDRNEKPAQNKSSKPRSRYQHRNDKTYADVTINKNSQPARQRTNNQTLKLTQNNQRHHGNGNQNQRYPKPTNGRTHQRDQSCNPISNRQQ